jgi:beta-N-acetylhexosaminidase
MSERELRELVGQCLMIGIPRPELDDATRRVLADTRAGHVCLFGRNTPDPATTRRLTDALRAFVAAERGATPLIATDHEGGAVQRLTRAATRIPSAMAQGMAGPAHVTAMARIAARELRAVGIGVVLAPVADVNLNPANPVIGVRSFGSDPARVAACVEAAIRGAHAEGVACVAKHFPGHGDTGVDSHVSLPTLPFGPERLDEIELLPFRAAIAAGVDAVMVGHLSLPELDPSGRPSSLSPAIVTGLLREHLGWDGVIYTDCLEMQGVATPDRDFGADVALASFEAGADLIEVSHTRERQRAAAAAVFDAVRAGRVGEDRLRASAARVRALADRTPAPGDVAVVGAPAHRAEVARTAGAAIRVENGAGRLPFIGRVGALAAGDWSRTIAEDEQPDNAFVSRMATSGATRITPDDLDRVDAVVVGLRRIAPDQRDALAARLRGRPAAVVALREPYAAAAFEDCVRILACDEGPAFLDVIAATALGR